MKNDTHYLAHIYINMEYPDEMFELLKALHDEYDTDVKTPYRDLSLYVTVEGIATNVGEFRQTLDDIISEYYTSAIYIRIYKFIVDYNTD